MIHIIVATMNEIEGVKQFLPKIDPKWNVIIPDGRSTDGTFGWCGKHHYNIFTQNGKGLANAQMDAFYQIIRMSTASSKDIVITVSPDGNCNPAIIPYLISAMEGKDMVIASRFKGGAISYDDTILTKFGNKMFTWIINMLFGSSYSDALGIYRAYTVRAIIDMKLNHQLKPNLFRRLFPNLESWEVLSSIRAAKLNLRVGEILGIEGKRIGGDSKMKIPLHGTMTLLQIIFELL